MGAENQVEVLPFRLPLYVRRDGGAATHASAEDRSEANQSPGAKSSNMHNEPKKGTAITRMAAIPSIIVFSCMQVEQSPRQ